jgi:hypothetical protein
MISKIRMETRSTFLEKKKYERNAKTIEISVRYTEDHRAKEYVFLNLI